MVENTGSLIKVQDMSERAKFVEQLAAITKECEALKEQVKDWQSDYKLRMKELVDVTDRLGTALKQDEHWKQWVDDLSNKLGKAEDRLAESEQAHLEAIRDRDMYKELVKDLRKEHQ